MKVCLTIEGQRGLNWPRWQRIVLAAEALGFHGLYRSDHFYDADPPEQDSLELWTSLTWLAGHTRRIEFGPLVTPVSFRHPVFTARMAKEVDDLSGGRLVLGLGAGWEGGAREHAAFGFDLLDPGRRLDRFEEGLEVISRLLRQEGPVTFRGDYYQLQDAILLPRPQRPGGPLILIGGNGPRRVLPLAARFADEWNGIYRTPAQFAELNAQLDALLKAGGRRPADVSRSLMKGLVFGRDQAELERELAGRNPADLWEQGLIVGTPGEIVAQLDQLSQVGVQKVMVQWSNLDDLERLEAFATTVLPRLA